MTAFPSRWGLSGGDNQALFLKVFSGEVLSAFALTNVMEGTTRSRSITSGKSATFPIVGTANAAYHVPGENILTATSGTTTVPKYLQRPGTGEKIIHIDNILVSPIIISDIDEAMSHYDVRQPYSFAMGEALAKKFDLSLMQVIFHGSEDPTDLTGEGSWDVEGSGRQITKAAFETDVGDLQNAIKTAGEQLDANDAPQDGRHLVMRPAAYRLLTEAVETTTVSIASSEFSGTGANIGMGTIRMYQGFMLQKSNRLDDLRDLATHASAETGQRGTDYTGTFDTCVGIYWQMQGAATLKLLELNLQQDYKIEYQGTLMVARFAIGHGVLRPGACGSIVTA